MLKTCIILSILAFTLVSPAQSAFHTGGGSFNIDPSLADHREGGGFLTANPIFGLIDLNDATSLYVATSKAPFTGFTSAAPSDLKSDLTIIALLNNSLVVSKDAKSPSFKVLSQGGLAYLETAYKKYAINSSNYDAAKPLLSKGKLTQAEVLKLQKLGFTFGVSGSKVFVIDSNSKYVLPLK